LESSANHWVNPGAALGLIDIAKKNGHKAIINTSGSSSTG